MDLVFISARYSLGLTGHVQDAPTYLFTVNKLVRATPTSKQPRACSDKKLVEPGHQARSPFHMLDRSRHVSNYEAD